jgi:hypothetical protein
VGKHGVNRRADGGGAADEAGGCGFELVAVH